MNRTAHTAIRAGYNTKTAAGQAARLLANAKVQKCVEEHCVGQNLAKLNVDNLRKPEIAKHVEEHQSSHLLTIVNLNGSGKTCQTLSSGHDECFDKKSKSIKERTGILRVGSSPLMDNNKIAARVGRSTKHPKITTRPQGANGMITAWLAELRQTEKLNFAKPNI